jgi:hypothetical protein
MATERGKNQGNSDRLPPGDQRLVGPSRTSREDRKMSGGSIPGHGQ